MAKAWFWPAAAVALLAVTGCAAADSRDPSAAREPRRCFWPRNVNNFRVVNSSTVNIRVGRDVFRLDMFGSCPDLDWSSRLGLVTTGSSTICVGSGLGTSIVTRGIGGRGRQRCPVQSITALSPEEIQALPGRERP
jgi:hypothetical protein